MRAALQILAAQKFGAKAVVIAQNRIAQRPTRVSSLLRTLLDVRVGQSTDPMRFALCDSLAPDRCVLDRLRETSGSHAERQDPSRDDPIRGASVTKRLTHTRASCLLHRSSHARYACVLSTQAGEAIKASLKGVDPEDTLGSVGIAGFGHLYAWGYGQNGRLGLASEVS